VLALHTFDTLSTTGLKFTGLKKADTVTMILSALQWRKINGDIKLYCDKIFYSWLDEIGFTDIYSEIDKELLDKSRDPNINISKQYGFWASSKFYAMKEQIYPFFMLDMDLIVNLNLKYYTEQDFGLIAFGQERISNSWRDIPVYPPKENIWTPDGYVFDERLDWETPPVNCALTYFEDLELKDEYINEAFRFMKNNTLPDYSNNSKFPPMMMCYIEQRFLPMLAKLRGVKYSTFLSGYLGGTSVEALSSTRFFHLWCAKHIPTLRIRMYKSLIKDLEKRYPIFYNRYLQIENKLQD
jgi:hypothetical protein